MTYSLTEAEDLLTATLLTPDSLTLSTEQVDRAIAQAQSVTSETQQWQVYLSALAIAGIEEWLQKRSPNLSVSRVANAGNLLQVGGYVWSVVASEDVSDEGVAIAKQAIDQPSVAPHFYVLVEVLEELEQVRVYGYLNRNQVVQQALSQEDEATYLLPLTWFIPEPDQLLLFATCLEPAALVTPQTASTPVTETAPSLPELVEGLPLSPAPARLSEVETPRPPAPRALNVANWLRNQLDQIAEEWAWVLLPPPTFSPAMRSMRTPVEEFDTLAAELVQRRGIEIPNYAMPAYRDFPIANTTVRLYVATWEMPTTAAESNEAEPEWSLLLFLGTPPGVVLPTGTQLRIQDETQVLFEQELTTQSQERYIYAQVIGSINEYFWVSIRLADGTTLSLPPFTFNQG